MKRKRPLASPEQRRDSLAAVLRGAHADGGAYLQAADLVERAGFYPVGASDASCSVLRNDIQALRSQGYRIESLHGQGYRLTPGQIGMICGPRPPARRYSRPTKPKAEMATFVVAVCISIIDLLEGPDQSRALRAIARHYDL